MLTIDILIEILTNVNIDTALSLSRINKDIYVAANNKDVVMRLADSINFPHCGCITLWNLYLITRMHLPELAEKASMYGDRRYIKFDGSQFERFEKRKMHAFTDVTYIRHRGGEYELSDIVNRIIVGATLGKQINILIEVIKDMDISTLPYDCIVSHIIDNNDIDLLLFLIDIIDDKLLEFSCVCIHKVALLSLKSCICNNCACKHVEIMKLILEYANTDIIMKYMNIALKLPSSDRRMVHIFPLFLNRGCIPTQDMIIFAAEKNHRLLLLLIKTHDECERIIENMERFCSPRGRRNLEAASYILKEEF